MLALIAVLPEYAVGFRARLEGRQRRATLRPDCVGPDGGESNCSLVLANMTGANRLLIGVGWALLEPGLSEQEVGAGAAHARKS